MDGERSEVSPGYAQGQLQRALEQALEHPDPATRDRARAKAERWRQVLLGMADGTLAVGSRTPVAGTPSWVTLDVVHGGFATGDLAAERPLEDAERELVARLPQGSSARHDRERLNLWYLTDDGLARLRELLETGRYRIEVPEDGALPVVAWLLAEGRHEDALDLVAELRPWFDRLRLAPLAAPQPQTVGATVRLRSAHDVADELRRRDQPEQIVLMKRTLLTWNGLFDGLVELWSDTVSGDLPTLQTRGETTVVVGGWPCQRWPDDWAERRRDWLDANDAALEQHGPSGKHHHPRSNYARLARLLDRCPEDSSALSARDVGWVRRCLANTVAREGTPTSTLRHEIRQGQMVVANAPDHSDIAKVVADRMARYPADRGIPTPAAVTDPVTDEESGVVPSGTAVPCHLAGRVRRAVEAPIADLIDDGIITSAEVLATVLPQVTAQVMAEGIADPALQELYRQVYGAFRRRRSLLLLDLAHQVQIEELPWVASLPRADDVGASRVARGSLEQVSMLALTGFPATILPNPLVRELSALSDRADAGLTLVEEVAADIFTGRFTRKWPLAAAFASERLAGSLYARYYDLPGPSDWPAEPAARRPRRRFRFRRRRWTPPRPDPFGQRCARRAAEVGVRPDRGFFDAGWVAANGATIEQSQILTTHNLVALVHGLGLARQVSLQAEDLALRGFDSAIARVGLPYREHRASLQAVKNAAYAWRQAIFFLSLVDGQQQRSVVDRVTVLAGELPQDVQERFRPAVVGLEQVLDGERFDAHGLTSDGRGRRLLGWTVGPHWLLPAASDEGDHAGSAAS